MKHHTLKDVELTDIQQQESNQSDQESNDNDSTPVQEKCTWCLIFCDVSGCRTRCNLSFQLILLITWIIILINVANNLPYFYSWFGAPVSIVFWCFFMLATNFQPLASFDKNESANVQKGCRYKWFNVGKQPDNTCIILLQYLLVFLLTIPFIFSCTVLFLIRLVKEQCESTCEGAEISYDTVFSYLLKKYYHYQDKYHTTRLLKDKQARQKCVHRFASIPFCYVLPGLFAIYMHFLVLFTLIDSYGTYLCYIDYPDSSTLLKPLPCWTRSKSKSKTTTMNHYPNMIDIRMPGSYNTTFSDGLAKDERINSFWENVNENNMKIRGLSNTTSEYRLGLVKAPMYLYDLQNTSNYLGNMAIITDHLRCTNPNAPYVGRSYIELSDPSSVTRVLTADSTLRTWMSQPYKTFSIGNICDGEDSDGTSTFIEQNGYEWTIIVIEEGSKCSLRMEIARQKRKTTSDTSTPSTPPVTMAIMRVNKVMDSDYTTTTQPSQNLTFHFTKDAEISLNDDEIGNADLQQDDVAFSFLYTFHSVVNNNNARIILNNHRPTILPTFVSMFAVSVYQSLLVEMSKDSKLAWWRITNSGNAPTRIPCVCGGPCNTLW